MKKILFMLLLSATFFACKKKDDAPQPQQTQTQQVGNSIAFIILDTTGFYVPGAYVTLYLTSVDYVNNTNGTMAIATSNGAVEFDNVIGNYTYYVRVEKGQLSNNNTINTFTSNKGDTWGAILIK